jgi:DNA mismatch repair ATPase MutS
MSVVERAREVLREHERKEATGGGAAGPVQIRLFEPEANDIKQKIRSLNVDEMRPVEALRFLEDLQKELG